MPGAIKCFACGYHLLGKTGAGETDKWGGGPYIDFSTPALGELTIRLYTGQENQKVGIVCPICKRVTYIKDENIEEIK